MEEWRPVVGYEGIYEVSSLGRVRRIAWAANRPKSDGGVLKPYVNKGGYVVCRLYHNGHHRLFLVHRLVMAAFVGPIPAGLQVNHRDFVRTNNAVANLEYLTVTENIRYSAERGRWLHKMGELHPFAKVSDAEKEAIIADFKASGLSYRKYWKAKGVHHSTLRQWVIGRWRGHHPPNSKYA